MASKAPRPAAIATPAAYFSQADGQDMAFTRYIQIYTAGHGHHKEKDAAKIA